MVLAELGSKLSDAISKLSTARNVDETVLNDTLRDIGNALIQADVDFKLVAQFRQSIKRQVKLDEIAAGLNKQKIVQKAVFDGLVALVEPAKRPFKPRKGKTNVIMFVGLQGAGKTTTITKFGYYYRRKGWKVGLVCADTFRAGAFAQLKQNATKAKLAFYGSHTETDPVKAAKEGVDAFRAEQYEIILVDTSGRHKQEAALFEEMQQIQGAVKPNDTVFILDASIGQAAKDQAQAFQESVSVGSVVITKMDGHAKGGGALSAVAATQSPILFLGTGEHMDDLDMFDPEAFVRQLLGMGNLGKLTETIQMAVPEEKMKELQQRFEKGERLRLRDMRDQFESLMSMGSISKVMGMIPGMSQMMPAMDDEAGKMRLKKFVYMMDSMTEEELDADTKLFTQSRIMRIARGAGVWPQQVQELLIEYQRMTKLMQSMAKMKKGGHGGKNPRNQSANAQQLAQMVPPQMLQQMGGAAGLQKMINSMGGIEGLMKGFGGGNFKMPK